MYVGGAAAGADEPPGECPQGAWPGLEWAGRGELLPGEPPRPHVGPGRLARETAVAGAAARSP